MAGEKPEMNQVELHPFLPQEELVKFCRENDILLTAFSPLGSPDSRADRHRDDPKLLDNPTVSDVAKKHGATVAQVLIAWSLSRGIAVVPKSVNRSRIIENFRAVDVALDGEDLQALATIGITHRFADGSIFTGPQSPYDISDLWDV